MSLTPRIDKIQNNILINGDMRIAQRGTSFAAVADSTYTLDRIAYYKVGAMVHTITQDTDVPTLAQAGYLFQNSIRLNLTTPDTSIAAGDYLVFGQNIEGYNFAKMAQKTMTLSFWVKATLAGTYCVAFRNSISDRSMALEYTINAANTWEFKVLTVPASPADGTWDYATGIGLKVYWVLACGTTFQTSGGSWQNGNFFATANQVNGVNTGATDFRLTGICLNEGELDSPAFSLFARGFLEELQACQRYYEKSYSLTVPPATPTNFVGTILVGNSTGVTANVIQQTEFKVNKRAVPQMVGYNPNSGATSTARGNSGVDYTLTVPFSNTVHSVGVTGFQCAVLNIVAGSSGAFHWTADSEL